MAEERVAGSLWAHRRCLMLCCIVAMANMQYGFDTSAIGALQAMPGFLAVFGYKDPSSSLGYGIDVCFSPFLESNIEVNDYMLNKS